jgi:hypothetical protein
MQDRAPVVPAQSIFQAVDFSPAITVFILLVCTHYGFERQIVAGHGKY